MKTNFIIAAVIIVIYLGANALFDTVKPHVNSSVKARLQSEQVDYDPASLLYDRKSRACETYA